MPYTLAPYDQRQYFDDNGNPLAGGFVYTYLSGTSTPATTYSDSTGTPNSNPIELDSSGRTQAIYLDALSYKFVLKDADGVAVGFPIDPVTSVAVGAGAGVGSIFTFGGNPAAAVTTTGYPSGATFDTLHPGTAVYVVDSADLVGTYALQANGLMFTGGTLTVAIVNLIDGAPDTPLATCSITSLTGEVATSGAITFASGGVEKQYGIKVKVSANTGFAWGISLIRTS